MSNILIITQNASISSHLVKLLDRIGHTVIGTPKSMDEAIASSRSWANTIAPDIVYIDAALAIKHGATEVTRMLSNELRARRTILIISNACKATAHIALEIEPDSYLTAPVSDQGIYSSLTVAFNPAQNSQMPAALKDALKDDEIQAWTELPDDLLNKVSRYVRANLNREITLKDLAKSVAMSESKFARSFKARTGITPYQYVLKERLEVAKDMLRYQANMSLLEIADATGFSSQSHFSTVFKKSTSITPLKYRRQLDLH